jgi:hypothetical protein
MTSNRLTMATALLGAVAALGACSKSPSDNGQQSGAANINVHMDKSITDVSKLTLTVQSPSQLPTALNVPLVQKSGQFSALVNNLKVGTDYIFTADAKDSTNASIFHGQVSNVSIAKGATAQVSIYLSQVNPQGSTNSAPVIDAVTFDANQVAQGGTVHLTAAAHDPDAGQTSTLSFVWTPSAGCGTISNATATGGSDSSDRNATATYTAPFANVDCQINLTVTDALGASNKAAISIRVGLGSNGSGNAKVSAVVNGAPIIQSLTSDPAQIVLGSSGNTPGLTVVAVDPENDAMTYAWAASPACTTVFGAPTSSTTSFAVTAVTAGTTSCTFSVTITDGVWPNTSIVKNTVVSSLTLPVSQPSVFSPPLFGLTYQSEDAITGGDGVVLAAVATDPAAGALTYTYSWAVDANTGTAFTVGSDASLGLDPIFTAAGTWTVPAGAENASTATFTVTATSSVSNLSSSYVFVFAPANNPCVAATDGTSCVIPTNKCITAATCQNHACVATAQTNCPASTVACQTNACVPSTGLCALSPAADGSACTDGNGCTSGDICGGGSCVTTPVTCPTAPVCYVTPACVSTGDSTHTCAAPAPASNTTSCSDSDPCTTGDMCNGNGVCVGAPLCAAPQVCQVTNGVAGCTTPACMDSQYAKQFLPPFQGNAMGADGTPWIVGNIYNPFDFSTNTNACALGTGQCVTSTGSADVFLAKLDPATGLATLTKTFGQVLTPNSTDQSAAGVAVASNGNVLVIGQFASEIDFTPNDSNGGGNGAGVSGIDFLTTTASSSNYLVTLDATGNPVKAIGSLVGTGALLSVASNPTQSAFAVCGKASSKATGILTGTNTAGGGMDIVVAKINAATGAVVWGKQFGGTGDQICNSVAMDNNGDVIIAGGYNGALTFGSLPAFTTISDTTASLLYVARLQGSDGTPLAASTWGTSGKVAPSGLTVDASSNIIVAGSLGATTTVGSITLTDLGATDVFVLKLTSALAPVWGKTFGDASFDQQAKGVATSSNGDVYVAGLYIGSLGAMNLTSASNTNSDGFVAHLAAADGSVVCAHTYGDANGAQGVSSIAVARAASGALANEVGIGGGFSNTITFGGTQLSTGSPSTSQSYYTRLLP